MNTLERIKTHKFIAILRHIPARTVKDVARALYDGGVRIFEVTFNPSLPESVEDTQTMIRTIKALYGDEVSVGAGTVLKPEQVDQVREAGGEFIISPNVNCKVIRRTKELGMFSMPGFATPSEAFEAIDAGADILKAFPCGTPENISVLKSVIPLPVFAVGGVLKDNKRAYLATSDGLGVGIGIYRPEFSPEELYDSAKAFMEE